MCGTYNIFFPVQAQLFVRKKVGRDAQIFEKSNIISFVRTNTKMKIIW